MNGDRLPGHHDGGAFEGEYRSLVPAEDRQATLVLFDLHDGDPISARRVLQLEGHRFTDPPDEEADALHLGQKRDAEENGLQILEGGGNGSAPRRPCEKERDLLARTVKRD